jgi:hypothetical protein
MARSYSGMKRAQRFARLVYLGAAIYGIVALAPQYFLEEQIGRDYPPPITHPEHFYGFVGLALVWQFAFLLIARDVQRFRPLMPITVLEKLVFGIPALLLWNQGRAAAPVAAFGVVDLTLGALFLVAFLVTRGTPDVQGTTR